MTLPLSTLPTDLSANVPSRYLERTFKCRLLKGQVASIYMQPASTTVLHPLPAAVVNQPSPMEEVD